MTGDDPIAQRFREHVESCEALLVELECDDVLERIRDGDEQWRRDCCETLRDIRDRARSVWVENLPDTDTGQP